MMTCTCSHTIGRARGRQLQIGRCVKTPHFENLFLKQKLSNYHIFHGTRWPSTAPIQRYINSWVPGIVMRAVFPHTTTVSSTKQQSGCPSSAGSTWTSGTKLRITSSYCLCCSRDLSKSGRRPEAHCLKAASGRDAGIWRSTALL